MAFVAARLSHFSVIQFAASRLTSSSSARPVSVVTLAGALSLFGENPTYYLLTQLLLWAPTLGLLSYSARHILGVTAAWLLALLMIFPFFCSTVLLSSYYAISEYGLSTGRCRCVSWSDMSAEGVAGTICWRMVPCCAGCCRWPS